MVKFLPRGREFSLVPPRSIAGLRAGVGGGLPSIASTISSFSPAVQTG